MANMTPSVRKMYKEAKDNQEFKDELKASNPAEYWEPTMFTSELLKTAYAAIYYGWLVGKGIYDKDKYY